MYPIRIFLLTLIALAVITGIRCGGDGPTDPGNGDSYISITPDSTVVMISASQQFDVSHSDDVQDVIWFVASVRGGTPSTGVVNASGLYIAPGAVPEDSTVEVKVFAVGNSSLSATATVVIRGGGGASSVRAVPADTTLAPGQPMVFDKEVYGCASEEVAWSVEPLLGGGVDAGSIGPDGSYTVPAGVDQGIRLLVRASSQTCTDRTGIAVVTVVPPHEFIVELEDYAESHDEEAGNNYIRIEACSKASGGAMVKGLDYIGEYIDVPFNVDEAGTYEVTLAYATLPGDTLGATVIFTGCGSALTEPEVDFFMDKGAGLG